MPDHKQAHIAAYLHAFFLGTIFLFAVFLVVQLILGRALNSVVVSFIVGFIGLMTGIWVILRLGYVQLASILFVSFTWAALTYQAWRADGLRDSTYVAQLIVILLATLLFQASLSPF